MARRIDARHKVSKQSRRQRKSVTQQASPSSQKKKPTLDTRQCKSPKKKVEKRKKTFQSGRGAKKLKVSEKKKSMLKEAAATASIEDLGAVPYFKPEIKRKDTIRKMLSSPHSITINHRGELVVTEWTGRVKILSWNGKYRTMLPFNNIPIRYHASNVAVSNDGTYYIAAGRQILICRGKRLTTITKLPIQEDIHASGITLTNDGKHILITDLLDSDKNSVKKYTTDGAFVAKYEPTGDMSLDGAWILTTNSKNHVIVIDHRNYRIQVLDSDLRFMDSFDCVDSDGVSYKPHYVCVDSEDNIYVCNFFNNRIMIYNSQFQLLDHLDANHPRSVVVSRDTPMKMALTEGDIVKVLHF